MEGCWISSPARLQAESRPMSRVEILGLLGFGLSVVLACLRIWEALCQRPSFHAKPEWTWEEGVLTSEDFRFTITNVGRAVGAITEAYIWDLSEEMGSGDWRDRLPITLSPGETSPVFSAPVDARGFGSDSVLRLIEAGTREQEWDFPIPSNRFDE